MRVKGSVSMYQKFSIGEDTFDFELPGICPFCGIGIQPQIPIPFRIPAVIPYKNGANTYFVFECPVCTETFFAVYEQTFPQSAPNLVAVFPHPKPTVLIPADLKELFPDFFELYNQANIAERNGLSKITGMAYRKALEILVKQYLIQQTPDEKEKILNEALGRSIDRISSAKIQSLAKAISWIGNDQTHMVQRHPDYNVPEMKNFMLALCHLIIAEHIADDAVGFVSS